MTEDTRWNRLVDRRSGNRGDARRDALLGALEELLREQSLEEVNVAEISRRAGVTRSAFYFYFESKAIAVMALMQDLYDAAADANELLVKAEGEPEERGAALVPPVGRRRRHGGHRETRPVSTGAPSSRARVTPAGISRARRSCS